MAETKKPKSTPKTKPAPDKNHAQPSSDKTAAMADLREFLRQAGDHGELTTVSGAEVDGEIGAIFELSQEHLYPPVLLFDNIPGFDPNFRILSNVRNAHFMVGDLTLDAVKAYRLRPKEKSEPIPPQEVNSGPVMDNVIEGAAVDVRKFPAPKWHADDGGHYIGTECMVIIRDRDSGWVNIGTYRVMIQDDKTLGIFIEPGKHGDVIRRKYWARGEACPIAVSVGQAPILGVVAAAAARQGEDEYAVAGGRIGRPVKVVLGKETGLPIPAEAELVFEGYMPPPEEDSRTEGPFGEWPGYYASADRPEPVLQVKTIYHRNDAIIVGQPPVKPNYPGRQIKIPRVAAQWDAIEAAGVPEVKGVWKMQGGGSRFIDVVSIKQLHAGHAKMAGLVAAGCGPGAYMTRMVIVVDDDIDITNPAEVMWAMATRWDPKTQTDIIDGCYTGHIDPVLSPEKRAAGDITTSRMIVYAVRPYHWKDDFPKVNAVSKDYAEEVRRKWAGKLRFLDDG
ncbi:MAG: UbiD family decarboxylase [Alphaproteobacteria bacterium]